LTKISHRLVILATFLIISALFSPLSVFAESSDADSAIASAKQQIVICYNAVKAAEAAGANITSMTSLLNEAGALLSESELAYSKNDFATAKNLAVQSSQSLINFVSQANALQASAAQQRSFDFWVNVVGSIIGAIGVIVAGLIVFRYVGKRYVQVEVDSDESS
jgi:hypothetical protein